MWPDRVLNPEPLTYESGALPTALRGPATVLEKPCNRTEHIHCKPIILCYANYRKILIGTFSVELSLMQIQIYMASNWDEKIHIYSCILQAAQSLACIKI